MKLLTLSVYLDEEKLEEALRSELATKNSYEFDKWVGSKTLEEKVKHQFHWLYGSGITFNKIDKVNNDNNNTDPAN